VTARTVKEADLEYGCRLHHQIKRRKARKGIRMNKNILVIDDEEAIRKSFVLAFEDTSFEVTTAESGIQGIELVKTTSFDLIFLDLKMPELNGVETLKELRGMNKSVPIYIITAFYEEYFDELKRAEKNGLNFELMRKPIGGDDIVMVAESVLESPTVG
jgi:CheY-like chemotaxis protein